jgi:hypothetical protein
MEYARGRKSRKRKDGREAKRVVGYRFQSQHRGGTNSPKL